MQRKKTEWTDQKEGWALKNWCFWTMVLEKTLESPLDSKEIKPVNPKRNWSWIFIGSADAEAEAPILWPPDAKNWLIGKDPDTGKDRWQEEKGMTEDEMVGWHHWLDGHEYEQAPGDGNGQGSLAVCCSPWGHKESDTTEWLKNNHNAPCKSLGWTCIGKYAPTYLDALVCVPTSHSLSHGGEKGSIQAGCIPTVYSGQQASHLEGVLPCSWFSSVPGE